jgi:lysozyme
VGIAAAWLTGHYWAPFGSGTTLAAVGNAALAGFSGGLVSSGGDLKAAFQGALTGGAFGYVGGTWAGHTFGNYAGHALVGCASGAMNGGGGEGCARGAVSQVISKWVTVETRGLGSKPLQFAVATMTGGAVSAISGGKFATGAQTAAFGYLFNELAKSTSCEQRGYNCFSLSSEGREAIQRYEGFSLTVYDDGVGIPTVGWGHRVVAADGLAMGDTITMDQAQALFDRDVGRFIGAANRLIPLGSTQGQFDAAVSIMYNIGEEAFARSSLLQAWRAGDFGAMNIQWMRWNRAGGRVMNGLTIRRADELKLFYPYQDRFKSGG